MSFVAEGLGVRIERLAELSREISPLRDPRGAPARAPDQARAARRSCTPIRRRPARSGGWPHSPRATRGRRSSSTRSTGTCSTGTSTRCALGVVHGARAAARAADDRASSPSAPRCGTTWSRSASRRRERFTRDPARHRARASAIGIGSETRRAETRRLLGISPGRFVVGWIGRMTGVKRTDDVLVTLQKLRERGVDARLCHGRRRARPGGTRAARASSSASPAASSSSATRRTWRRTSPPSTRSLLPSRERGNAGDDDRGARGRRARRRRRGSAAFPTWCANGIDGFLVEPGDTDAMADRLAELAGDLDLRRRMGEGGRDHVQARYSVGRLLDDVDDLYRSLLQHGGNSRFPP